MNTERPDNDDDARAAGDAGTADAPEPGAAEAGAPTGSNGSDGVAEKAGSGGTGGTSAASGTDGRAGASETGGAAGAPRTDGALETPTTDGVSKTGATDGVSETGARDGVSKTGATDGVSETGDTDRAPEAADAAHDAEGASARSEDDAAGSHDAPAPVHELPRDGEDRATQGGGRPRTPAVIASVAAAVLLIGGGGAWLAADASGGSGGGATSGAPGGDGTPPPLALDGYSDSTSGGNGIAPGEPNPYGATYRVDGTLPEGPAEAPVYLARGEVAAADVTRLAKALGVAGTPVAQGEVWRIGGQDGSGPSLQVNRQAPGTWTFTRYAPGTDDCKGVDTCTAPESGGTPVGEDVAQKAAAPVLKALGQDDAKVDASQVMGAQRVVNASPEVGGVPTHGWTTGITVGSGGEVVAGSGPLKAPVKGETYPVVGAEKALELMEGRPKGDHRMGIGGCAGPVPLKDRPEDPCDPAAGGTPQPDTVTVRDAVFGLAAHVVDGRQALVPSWLFEVTAPGAKDPFTVTYPAVDPKYLASPSPSRPGDGPTSQPGPREVEIDGYRAEGAELTVTFTGGVCADYDVTADEKGGEVTVTVTSTPWRDKVCIMIAKQFQKTVPLDEPLGSRKVVDADGKAIPLAREGARLPAPPTGER
ncbi:hypothetical protein [Streptomyces dubilierae]|uniref:Large membrane protein n=1 Tax=Streptomyces dubilierae TaxID=3075533 RepID=A0ABU2PJD8_9ACTN|nr:hypothetical protein [Streptomyces sp. DSM 41921]MDT0391789.1 hypothetical protein [Streptomyces sp. DSM 41921]